jgi:hypothetical protein
MNRTPFRIAVAFGLSLAALPALALEPLWPALENPRPARVLPAQPEGSPSPVSGDPSWPTMAVTMPAISNLSRTDPRPVFDPPVEAHVVAMNASRPAVQPAPPAQLAAK